MTEEELKDSNRICVLKVKGFPIHSNIDSQNKQPDYIIFIKSLKIRHIKQTNQDIIIIIMKIYVQFTNYY